MNINNCEAHYPNIDQALQAGWQAHYDVGPENVERYQLNRDRFLNMAIAPQNDLQAMVQMSKKVGKLKQDALSEVANALGQIDQYKQAWCGLKKLLSIRPPPLLSKENELRTIFTLLSNAPGWALFNTRESSVRSNAATPHQQLS